MFLSSCIAQQSRNIVMKTFSISQWDARSLQRFFDGESWSHRAPEIIFKFSFVFCFVSQIFTLIKMMKKILFHKKIEFLSYLCSYH